MSLGFAQTASTSTMARQAVARRAEVPPGVWALSIYVFVIVSRFSELFVSLHLGLITMVVAILLLGVVPRREPPLRGGTTTLALAVSLVAVASIGALFSLWPGGSIEHVTHVDAKLLVLLAVIVFAVRTRRDLDCLAWGFLAAAFVLELNLVAARLSDRAKFNEMYDRNDLAFVMTCVLPLAAAMAMSTRGVRRLAAAAVAVPAVPAIVLTKSRAGFVGLVVIGTMVLFRTTRGRPLARTALMLTTVVTLAAVAPQGYWDRIATMFGSVKAPATVGGGAGSEAEAEINYDNAGFKAARLDLWKRGVGLMASHPVFGLGSGTFEIGEASTHDNYGKWTPAHNSFIQIGAELGLPGLVLFVSLIARAIVAARRVARGVATRRSSARDVWLARGLELSLFGYVIVGFTLSQAYSPILYLLLGLTTALASLAATSPGEA